MPQGRVLSTDPNAGEPLRASAAPRVLSSDPNAGEPLRVASKGRNVPGRVADASPAIGGMVGGIAGGIPGAVVGGAAGKGLGDLVTHGAEIPGALADVARNLISEPMATVQGLHQGIAEGAMDTAKAAGIEGVSQFAGGKIAQAGGVMAKWLMNRATTRVSEKLMREFPDLADTLIDNALTVSKGGYAKAKALLDAAKSKTRAVLTAADDAGATIPVHMTPEVAESFKTAMLEDVIKARGLAVNTGAITAASNRLPAHLRVLWQHIDDAVANGGALDLKPSHADVLKRRLQKESKALYGQAGAPNGPRAMGMESSERAELASQLNARIEQIATGYRASNAEAQPLIGAVRGIKQAIRPNGNLYQAMVRPAVGGALGAAGGGQSDVPGGQVLGAVAGAALTSPAGMSREAILLASPQVQQMLKQLPRATALALTEILSQRSGTQPPAIAPQE